MLPREVGDLLRDERLERGIRAVFEAEQQRLPMHEPAIIARPRRVQRNDAPKEVPLGHWGTPRRKSP